MCILPDGETDWPHGDEDLSDVDENYLLLVKIVVLAGRVGPEGGAGGVGRDGAADVGPVRRREGAAGGGSCGWYDSRTIYFELFLLE